MGQPYSNADLIIQHSNKMPNTENFRALKMEFIDCDVSQFSTSRPSLPHPAESPCPSSSQDVGRVLSPHSAFQRQRSDEPTQVSTLRQDGHRDSGREGPRSHNRTNGGNGEANPCGGDGQARGTQALLLSGRPGSPQKRSPRATTRTSPVSRSSVSRTATLLQAPSRTSYHLQPSSATSSQPTCCSPTEEAELPTVRSSGSSQTTQSGEESLQCHRWPRLRGSAGSLR